jgi:stearoyl-CoA desaturase (Delta-9 desaturase)
MCLLEFLSNGLLSYSWWQIILAVLLSTHVTIVCMTIYLHRCQAHRSLELHLAVSHTFRFWLWMTTGIETGPWTAVHRKHHARCETDEDPHSPQTRGIWKVVFEGSELYTAEARNEETLHKFSHGTPTDWMERNVYARYPNLGVGLLMVIDVALFGIVGVSVWAVQMIWIPFWAGGVVNGCAHFWGYRNFGSADKSTNLFPLGILIGGEELHNNHHAYATSAKLSNKWYEFDIGWMYISILSSLRLAKVKRVAPTPHLVKTKSVLDNDTLEAVLSNRYEIMASYARLVSRACRYELVKGERLSPHEKHLARRERRRLFKEQLSRNDLQQLALPEICAGNPKLRLCLEFRTDLSAIWERSNASHEQLLFQLDDWCRRAEQSGVKALEEFSLRLRQYA